MVAVTLPPDKRTLLQMVQNACAELALTQPTSLFGNSNPQAAQFLALAQREGYDFSKKRNGIGGWTALRTEYQFTLTGSGLLAGNFTSGNAQVTNITPNTSTIVAGQTAVFYGIIPTGTTVLTVDSASQITLSQPPSFSTGSGIAQSFYTGQEYYPLPTDIDHQMTQTYWDRTFRWQLLGPLSPQERQVLLSGISPTGPRRRFWIVNNQLVINPVPSSAATEVFEYYSNAWSQTTLATTAQVNSRFQNDSDYFLLDDNVMELGLKWRFRKAKGLSFDAEQDDYDSAVEVAIAADGGGRNLPLNASASGIRLLNEQNIPDTGFGS